VAWAGGGRREGARTRWRHKKGGRRDEGDEGIGGENRRSAVMLAVLELTLYSFPISFFLPRPVACTSSCLPPAPPIALLPDPSVPRRPPSSRP
jgi:hypothetical protein